MATETNEAAGQAVEHGAEASGMPQLDFATFPNQIFWLLITLVVIYLILSRVVLPRVGSVLSERQGTITNEEQLDAALGQIREQCLKRLADGTPVILA